MKRPVRWRDEESVSPNVRRLLERAGRSRALPDAVRMRSIGRLDRYLVWPGAATLLLWLKGAAIAATIGIAGVVAVATIRPMIQPTPVAVEPAPKKAHASAPVPVSPKGTIASAPASIAPALPSPPPSSAPASVAHTEPDRTPTARVPVPAPSTPPAAPAPTQPEVDPLTREAAMLENARASLDRDPIASLSELDACAAAFPSGTLRTERELLAVEALTRAGMRDEARRRAESLLSAAGGSIYGPRVRSMLEKLQAP